MRLETKLAPAQTIGVTDTGTFLARVAAFGNVDAYGDRLLPGAFAASLEAKAAGGKTIPILWNHNFLEAPIGYTSKAYETPDGLVVEGQLLMEDARAKSVHTLMAQRAVTEFSFGFIPDKSTLKEEGGELVRELTQVDLIEVSPVLYPANDETELLSIKAAVLEAKAGATLSTASRKRLGAIHDSLAGVAAELKTFLDDPGDKAKPAEDAAAEAEAEQKSYRTYFERLES